MTTADWPAWMPEPPYLNNYGPDQYGDYFTEDFRIDLLAWYAEAKRRDPDFGYVTARRSPLLLGTDVEAAKRAAFPLPEEVDDGNPDGA